MKNVLYDVLIEVYQVDDPDEIGTPDISKMTDCYKWTFSSLEGARGGLIMWHLLESRDSVDRQAICGRYANSEAMVAHRVISTGKCIKQIARIIAMK